MHLASYQETVRLQYIFLSRNQYLSCVSNYYFSGPAKGYTEALENRLRVTEMALLRLWHASTDDAVAKAFEGDLSPHNGQSVTQGEIYPCAEPAKSLLVSQWEEYPLESTEDLQRWATDVMGVARKAHGHDKRVGIGVGPTGLPRDFGQQRRTPCGEVFDAGEPPLELPAMTRIDVEPVFRETLDMPTQPGPAPTLGGNITVGDGSGGAGPILQPARDKLWLPDEFKQEYLW